MHSVFNKCPPDQNSNKSPPATFSKWCPLGDAVEVAGRGGARASEGSEEVGGRATRGGGLTPRGAVGPRPEEGGREGGRERISLLELF